MIDYKCTDVEVSRVFLDRVPCLSSETENMCFQGEHGLFNSVFININDIRYLVCVANQHCTHKLSQTIVIELFASLESKII